MLTPFNLGMRSSMMVGSLLRGCSLPLSPIRVLADRESWRALVVNRGVVVLPSQAPDPLSMFRVLGMDDAAEPPIRVDHQMVAFVVASARSARGAPSGGLVGFFSDVFEF